MAAFALARTDGPKTAPSPFIPIVALGVASFWLWHAVRLHDGGALPGEGFIALLVWFASMTLWGLATSWLSVSGRYRRPEVLSLAPGLWVPPLPVAATAVALLVSPALRNAFLALAEGITQDQFILMQTLRIAAIGGVTKAILGRLPRAFGLGTGIPDLIFGISAAVMLGTGSYAALAPATLAAWNIAGALIFIMAALILQLTLPGPLQLFRGTPDGRELLDFPMVLAPTLLGPLLLIGNILHAAKLVLTAG